MDIVQRLIRLLALFSAFVMASGSYGAACPSTYVAHVAGYVQRDWSSTGGVGVLNEICAAFGAGDYAEGSPTLWETSTHYASYCGRFVGSNWQRTSGVVSVTKQKMFKGPDGVYSSSDPGTCGRSLDEICASLGDLGSADSKWLYKGSGLSTCRGDCVFIPETSGYDKTTGYTIGWGKLINHGLSCGSTADTESKGYSDSDADKPADAPHAGEKGYCPGTYNGTTIWVKCSSTNETTKTDSTTTQTQTNGGTSTTGTTTTSTTSKTSCDGSNCTTTTTTTTTNADGTKTDKTETSSKPQSDFCTANPNATACKKPEGSFGGSCSAGFSCEGDAVQCAIAREAYKRNCELLEKETPESTLGKNIANGEDRPVGHPGNSPEIVNVSGNINQTNPYGGLCPPDINLNVYGKTVIVPLSNACDIFKWMGYIAVAFTMYAAARITMSGIST